MCDELLRDAGQSGAPPGPAGPAAADRLALARRLVPAAGLVVELTKPSRLGPIRAFSLKWMAGRDGGSELVLAQSVRHRRAQRDFVTVPGPLVAVARMLGAGWFVYRRDGAGRRRVALACPLAELPRRAAWITNDDEFLVPFENLDPIPFPAWSYSTTVVRLPMLEAAIARAAGGGGGGGGDGAG